MQTTHTVDLSTCKKCRICAAICPAAIIQANDAARFLPERENLCIRCGQCMAACPTCSISVEGLSYAIDFFELPKGDDSRQSAFSGLISTRRSVRNFKEAPVPRQLLEKIVDAISFAPPGYTPLKVELTIINNRDLIRRAVPIMAEMYDRLIKLADNPETSAMFKTMVGEEAFEVLSGHVLPLMRMRMPGLKSGAEDTIARGAPALILFHAARQNEDIFIALAYGLLAAHSLGLGASAIGLIPPVVERNPELRKMFHIPADNKVLASMIIGYPRYKYSRGIKRTPAGVTWVE